MPFLLHLFLFLIPNPALLSHGASVASESQPVKLVVSERCISDPNAIEGQEFDLTPGSPLVLTHRIRLVPSTGSGSCCQSEFAAVNERIEALEREVSELREKCGGLNGGCCTSQQSQGVGCSTVRPPTDECLNDCNDQGRCIDGKCVCFAGFSGPDCSVPDCPGDCSNKGKCVNGKCVCDPGFAGPDCSVKTCPNNCSNNGRCVNGKCVCNAGFTGSDCSIVQCPGNCNNKGRCVNGKCVCVAGFTGPDCSEKSCPGNCNNKGRCVDGKCVCNPEFTGPDCSERSCPKNCNNKGRCVNGKCVCDAGFTGLDCSEKSCPRNCNNKGRCVDGKCFCNSGFTGLDCSEKTCPGNCNNKGRCVDGKCVCNSGFTGLDCSEKTCPGNCNNKGRCVDGKCVCNSGFTGLDCSEKTCPGNCNNKGSCVNGKCVCDEGFTGLDCSEKTCPRNCKNKGRCVDGKCVCNPGFTGLDCSEKTCPGNCNNKGRCVNGKCVCNEGFTGLDCSEKTCPGNCKNKGRCVNGKCVCDAGFTGPDCSEKTCPNNCSNKGRCVNGKCVCDDGFTGPDCSEKTCPGNCNNKGRCVNGQCVCEVGFTGPDCSTKTCLNNCSNRGRCVNGKCVCNPKFAEPDCSECTDGFAGPDCATALIAVSHLSARNITESSVTLFWTPPAVQYNTYRITFTSEKENDQITERVNGGISSYTQVGLAPGQRYIVTIIGEKDGKMGAKSTTPFQTLISGPKNLHVVKTSTTSVIVQWEAAQGQIDRYILSTAPNQTDGSGEGRQEKTLPSGIDSAQIDGLQPGRLYDVSLVAVKDGTRSLPATVQATPDRTAGSSEEVKPLLGKGPKLQEGRFQKHPIQEELQKETLTTPSPSHSFTVTQRSVVPSETQDQPTNKLQTPSRDRHHALTSLQLPPSSNYRYSGGPILSGSSTSLIKGRHLPPPVSSRVSSQKPVQKIPFGNVSSPQSSHPPEVDKETLTKTTNSKESVQGLSKGSLVSSLPEAHFPKHKETINKTVPLYNRMPYRGPFPRRPNIGQNRTSTFQQPYRNPIRRPLLSRINNTAINRVEPETFSSSQHVLTPNRPPIFTRQRKNGTVIRLPPKLLGQIKTAGAAVENKSKETNILFPADTDSHPKSELSFSTDKASSKSNAKIQPVSGRSEMNIEHILPRVTISDNDTTLPNHQRASVVIVGRQNASNLKIRPTFSLKRINNTIIRLPSRIPALTNVNSTTIYSPFKNNNYETRLKDSKEISRDTGTKLFTLPTEGAPTGITDTLKGEGSENATEHINRVVPRVTSRDPEIPKIATRDHDLPSLANITTTLPLLINHNTESEIKDQRENVPDQNQNKSILRRKNGTLVRPRPKRPNQIKPNTPTFHSELKESVILPTDKPTAESNYKLQAVAAGLEVSNDNVLPRITTKAQDLSRITSPEQNLTIITSRNQDLLRKTERLNYLPKVTDKDQDLPITTRKQVSSKIIKENVATTPRKNGTFQPKPHADIEHKSTTIQSGLKDKGPNVGKVAEESTEFTDHSVSAGEEANNDYIPLNITNRDNSSPMQVKPEFHSISQKGPTSNFTATFTMKKKNGMDLRPALKRPSKTKIMPELGNLKQNKESSITIPQNTFNRNRRPPFTLQRKNGTNSRLPPKVLSQLRPDSGRKNSTQDLKLDWSTEVPHPTDKTKSRFPISEVPEDGISEIGVQNLTSNSFIIIWVAPEGRFKNFVIRITEEKMKT
ncbi:uncharacterized protein LOC124392249 isoform X1 [Silurus meridionalis]|uniref:Tenascin n=1 Tax=Silurus meridionalis TaxID=175797 RepID=A0A8T0BC24_SILME|nr:uncharacterized protein LOC124392249 isoform X1 [Silurus meridionalis]KAF7702544.1 hypothetical protein HF521_001827 [Silurus meridionalis]